MLTDVVNLFFWFAVLIMASYLLDRMWSYSLARWLFIAFSAPGIIVHELSHYVACKLTGAPVERVVLISREGGSVSHGSPKGGFLGQALISMAPFICIPLVLVLIGLLFDRVDLFACDLEWGHRSSWDFGTMLVGTFRSSWELVRRNLLENRSPWFLLYLYIAASMTVALAPSKKDFKNSWLGLTVVILLSLIWALLNDHFLRGLGWEAPVFFFIEGVFGWILAVGFVLCLFGTILGLPLFLIKYFIKGSRS